MTHKAKGNPKHDVTNGRVRKLFVQVFRYHDQRKLSHHSQKRPRSEHVKGSADNQLVHDGRKEENDKGRRRFGDAIPHTRKVQMAE